MKNVCGRIRLEAGRLEEEPSKSRCLWLSELKQWEQREVKGFEKYLEVN